MKQLVITLLVGIICVICAIAYDTVYQLTQDNRQLQQKVDGYENMMLQQEYQSVRQEVELRKRIRTLNEMWARCINSKPIVINRLQYRCYQVYDI